MVTQKTPSPKNPPGEKYLLALTGFSCNNNCLVCSVKNKEKFYPDKTTQEVIQDLQVGRQAGFCNVEFTGGEPSARQDIIKLVAAAKDLGYRQIAVSTNGRLFSYFKFCLDIIEAGLNKITFSLLGPDKKTHEAISRTPGSFDQLIQGVKNTQEFPNIHLNISSVICRLNYKNLKKFGHFVQSLNIKNWYLLDLIPDGHAKTLYDRIFVPLPPLSQALNSLIKLSAGFDELGFFDFPFCLFSPALRKTKNIIFINAKERTEEFSQTGYPPNRLKRDAQGGYSDIHKKNVDFCRQCSYYKECGGLWIEYLNRFGEKQLTALAKKNKCLK